MPNISEERAALTEDSIQMAAILNEVISIGGTTAFETRITVENVPELSYYSKMEFRDHSIIPNVPLKNGQLIDRILKWFVIG